MNESYLQEDDLMNDIWHRVLNMQEIDWGAPGATELGDTVYEDWFR